MKPQISIIMPAFNAAGFIEESIRSVQLQTFTEWELVVADDGSTDRTADIVSRLAADDARIRYLHQSHGRLGRARNTAIEHAASDFVAFLDSDDLWHPRKLEKQIFAINQSGADLIYTGGCSFFDLDLKCRKYPFNVPPDLLTGRAMFAKLAEKNRLAVSSVMARKSSIEAAGLFEESPDIFGAEDYDLWLKLATIGASFLGIPECLIGYRIHDAALSRNVPRMLESVRNVLCKHGLAKQGEETSSPAYRKIAAVAFLDEYFINARMGDFNAAIACFQCAWQLSPLTMLAPRRFYALIRHATLRDTATGIAQHYGSRHLFY